MISTQAYLEKLKEISRLELTERDIPETEPVFDVYFNTRKIVVPREFEDLAVYYDHNAETIWFATDRYFDGVDLDTKNWALQYSNNAGEEGILPMTYHSRGADDGGEDGMYYRGIDISIDLTRVAGSLTFNILVYSLDEKSDQIDYRLNTTPARVNISRGLYVNDTDSRLPVPKDTLTELVDKIEKLYQNQDLRNIDYNTLIPNTLPTINSIKMSGTITTNSKTAQGNSNYVHLDIPYEDLSNIPTINGVALKGALVSADLNMEVTTDGIFDTSSTNPIQGGIVSQRFNDVDSNFTTIGNRVTGTEGDITKLDTRLKAIEDEIGNMTFVPLTINSFNSNKNMIEVGAEPGDVKFTWTLGGNPILIQLNSQDLGIQDREKTLSNIAKHNEPYTDTYTLYAKDSKGNEDTKTVDIFFTYGVYSGVKTAPAAFDESFVEGFTKILQTSRAANLEVTANTDEFIFYCVPTSYGACTFSVGGFSGGFSKVATISITNEFGVTADYDIYKSDNAALGKTNVVIS